MTLARLARAASAASARPYACVPWLPGQDRYLRCTERFRLLRAGNQSIGKTTVLLADIVMAARGDHPYRPSPAAGEYMVLCASWAQSVHIQSKLWAMLHPSFLAPGTQYNPTRGFRGHRPVVRIRHLSGEYSTVWFKTTGQSSLDLAGSTINGAAFDEIPRDRQVYSEIVKRVQSTGGWVSIGATPIGAPVDWLREDAEQGRIFDIHVRLTPDEMVPVGWTTPRVLEDGTVCNAAWIEKITNETPEHERGVRIHGEWEVSTSDRYFSCFRALGSQSHVSPDLPAGDVKLALGVDHGNKPGKQVAYLIAVDDSDPAAPRVWVVDEYVDLDGDHIPDDDAAGILAMLARNGVRWSDLASAYGDRVHMPGKAQQKSNKDLAKCLAKRLRVPLLVPQMRTAKRGAAGHRGGRDLGLRWVFHRLTRNELSIHPRCKRLIWAMDNHRLIDDDTKDPIDALRYGLEPWVFSISTRRA